MRGSHFWLSTAIVLAAVAGFSTPNEAEDRVCISATSDDVRSLYATYANLLRQGDVEALTSLYSPDAILMGPGASSIRIGRAEVAGYYTAFLQRRPAVVPLQRVIRTDCDLLGATGEEALSLSTDGARTRTFSTRFALSFARFGEQWLIVHHHQELQDGPPSPDQPETASVARIVTGANPPATVKGPASDSDRAPHVVVPPSPLELPASAPVILTGQRRLVIEPIQTAIIDLTALEELSQLARQMLADATARPSLATDVAIPRIAYSLGLSAPVIEAQSVPRAAPASAALSVMQVASAEPVSAPPVSAPVASTPVVSTPPVSTPVVITLPAHPFSLPTAPPLVAPVPTLAAATMVQSAKRDELRDRPKTVPAVAGFTQRLNASSTATATAAALPSPARTVVPTKPASPTTTKVKLSASAKLPNKLAVEGPAPRSARFLRWEDGVPIFDE